MSVPPVNKKRKTVVGISALRHHHGESESESGSERDRREHGVLVWLQIDTRSQYHARPPSRQRNLSLIDTRGVTSKAIDEEDVEEGERRDRREWISLCSRPRTSRRLDAGARRRLDAGLSPRHSSGAC